MEKVVIGNAELWHGDCLEVMPLLPENSVDSIVTDPPYGLSFMGKDWDHGVPGVHFWIEALRVAKPGAVLLAFGGTRTFHRLAVAIEDAGWKLRDTIGMPHESGDWGDCPWMAAWTYSNGLPKSLNFGCKCEGSALPYVHAKETEQEAECGLRPLWDSDVPEAGGFGNGSGKILQPEVSEQGLPLTGQPELASTEIRSREPSMEGRRNIFPEERELQTSQICPMPFGIHGDGAERRLCDGAPPDSGEEDGALLVKDGGSPSRESQPSGQHSDEPRILHQQHGTGTQERGRSAETVCSSCGKLKGYEGWGTALKPAWEPVIMARKPFKGTVAENVLQHGTGGINIDGCRVDFVDEKDLESAKWGRGTDILGGNYVGATHSSGKTNIEANPIGRWPSNLIHDGSDEVIDCFPQSNGQSGDVKGTEKSCTGGEGTNCFGKYTRVGSRPKRNDSGSAARFFYSGKASKADRNEGCHDIEAQVKDAEYRQPTGNAMVDRIHGCGKKLSNHHPTVKPTALMRYLCRLVTPPGGTVLDMFMGSGSTGKAAEEEGFKFIGIDNSREYTDIAIKRNEEARKQLKLAL